MRGISGMIVAIAVAVSLGLGAGTVSADTREERLAVAQDYIDKVVADTDFAALITAMWRPMVTEMEAAGQSVTDSQKERLQELYMRVMAEPLRQVMLDQGPIMADLLSLAEITALRDFYLTPEGQAVMLKLPMMVEAQQPQIMEMVNVHLMPVLSEIQAILATP